MGRMYLPRHFEQTDPAAVHALMREHPLALLVVPGQPEFSADLVPLELAADGSHLRGHVARANPLWRQAGQPVLAVFQGPQAYVSPSWYPSKARHGKVVPTWNYTMVQARGVLQAVDDAPWLRELVGRLTDHHEGQRGLPWRVDDAPTDYVAQMLGAIVGIEIGITALAGKWKVSQNRDAADRDGVIRGMATSPPAAASSGWTVPDLMRNIDAPKEPR
jgi:transcriptional regulator